MNRDKLLIICYGYDGKNSNNANAICLDSVVEELSKSRSVDIITTCNEDVTCEIKADVNIHKIKINIKQNGKLDFKEWGYRVLNYISKEINMDEYSSVLTISFPFNILIVGFHIKQKYPLLKWLVYELDPYAYNKVLRFPKVAFFYRYIKENRIFKAADEILLTHELYREYSTNFFSKYRAKFKDIGIPLLHINNSTLISSKRCDLIYSGSFYSKVRNPEFMFKVLSKVAELYDFTLHIYGPKACEIDEKYKAILGDKLIIHGRVSKQEINQAIERSSILINIGNTVDNQLPSKVLEYIGTGKPIINFYSIDNDTSNSYLKLYPNSLLIKNDENETMYKVSEIIQFMDDNKNKVVPEKTLYSIFKYFTRDEVIKRINMSLE